MNLTKNQIRNLIIAGAVLIVLALIVWRWKSRSTFAVSTITETSTGDEATLYSNLSTCQNTFIFGQQSKLVIHNKISCQGSTVTAVSDAAHEYTANSSRIIVRGVSGDGTQTIKGYNGDDILVTGTPNPYTYTYTSPVPCSPGNGDFATFSDASNGTQGFSWLVSDSDVTAQNETRMQCLSSNVSDYLTAKCPNTDVNYVPAAGSASRSAYDTYQNNKNAIIAAYSRLIYNASGNTRTMMENARKADLTSALRNYLATACTGFYATTASMDPGSTAQTGYITSPYTTYTTTSGTSVTAGSNFNAALVTLDNINNWALYYTGGANAAKTTAATSRSFINDNGEYPTGTPNSAFAANVGPGTVTTLGPIAGTKSGGTVLAATATVGMNT